MKLMLKNSLPLKAGDIITDFRGRDWSFVHFTNGPISYGKIVVKDLNPKPGYEGAIREFFPSVFPEYFITDITDL